MLRATSGSGPSARAPSPYGVNAKNCLDSSNDQLSSAIMTRESISADRTLQHTLPVIVPPGKISPATVTPLGMTPPELFHVTIHRDTSDLLVGVRSRAAPM